MPTPVPRGRFGEYAAAITEGFCPACRVPLAAVMGETGWMAGRCRSCVAEWESFTEPRQIRWRGTDGEITWEIWSNDLDHVHGNGAWAE